VLGSSGGGGGGVGTGGGGGKVTVGMFGVFGWGGGGGGVARRSVREFNPIARAKERGCDRVWHRKISGLFCKRALFF